MMEKKTIFTSSKGQDGPSLMNVSNQEAAIQRRQQEKRHVSFAEGAPSENLSPNSKPFSHFPALCRSMSEGRHQFPETNSPNQSVWDVDGSQDPSPSPSPLTPTMDMATTMLSGLRKYRKKRKKKVCSEEVEEGSKRPSFVTSMAPMFRQWSKFATAIGTVTSPNAEANSGDETDEHETTSEDVFLQRFSTRYLALSSRCSVTAEENIGRKLSRAAYLNGEEKEEEEWGKLWIIHKWIRSRTVSPDGAFVFYWLSLVTICVLYNWWTLIARQCFKEMVTHDVHGLWFIFDTVTDFFFVVEIFVQLRTGYLEEGLLVVDAKKLARRYFLSKQFVLDAVALTPLDYFLSTYHPILRFPRLLKTYRPIKFYYMLESRTIYPNVIRVANWCHILLLSCHWFACFHFMVAGIGEFNSRWTDWTSENVGNTSLTRKYLLSLYWSTLTLTTIGTTAVPGSEYEYLFTIISYLIGVFVFAAIVVLDASEHYFKNDLRFCRQQVGNVITNRNARRLEFERLSDGAKQYMRYHKVPKDMQRRVQQWFDYSWSRGRMTGTADTHALSVLPDKLKTELALRVNLDTLRRVTMFQECQPQFLHDLVLKMRAVIFTPGDIVCRKGEVAREMYIIADGVLQVLNEDGAVLRVMRAGDFFGEIGVLNMDSGLNKRSADVRSVGYSELFCLSREDVLAATKDYPDAEAILREHGERRLRSSIPRLSKVLSSNCSKESISPETPSHRQSIAGSIDASVLIQSPPNSTLSRFNAGQNSIIMPHRRVERRSHSGGPTRDLLSFNFLDQRSRSSSLANALVTGIRQVATPSHVTNLLGCPVKEDPMVTSSLEPSMHNRQTLNSLEFGHMERLQTGYTCDEEMSTLKNAIHRFVCPEVYANVIHEMNRSHQAINAKFRTLTDLLKRNEIEVSVLRRENKSLKEWTQQRSTRRSRTSCDIKML